MNSEEVRVGKDPEELERKAASVLELSDDNMRKQFIDIAKSETPTQAFEKAFDLANEHFNARMARDFAKATRYLAIIMRDYGSDIFNATVVNN